MKKLLRSALVVAVVGAVGLAACDATQPPKAAVPAPVAPEAIPPGETLTDVVRKALAEIVRDPDSYSRARRLGALLPTLGQEAVAPLKETLEDPTIDLNVGDVELLVRFWATHQPEEASRWALTSNDAFRRAAVYTALMMWAEADPQAATSVAWPWAEEHSWLSGEVHRGLIRGWYAANQPRELRRYLHDLGMGIPQQRAIATYVRAMLQTEGTDALFRWADSLPDDDPQYKLAVFRQTVALLQWFDHEAALRWCEANCDGPYGKNVRNIIAGRWAMRDGAAALEWLSRAPAGHDTNIAVRFAFGDWVRRDREAALAWMAARTNGGPTGKLAPWLEPVVPVYALSLAETAPADAIEWAKRIEAGEDREWVLIQIARDWRRRDEAAAEAWLLQSELSEQAREKARAPGRKRPQNAEPQPKG